ncbi:ABC transporter ATP-binding protein [Glaciimonas sp. GG7]
MSSVTLHNIRKDFGKTSIIRGVDIAIPHGEFAVFVGPSGCGKSTLLRMVAGLDSPTSGTIMLGERVINDVPAKNRNVSMVFQSYALYPHMSVERNMGFGLMISKTAPEMIRSKVAAAAKTLGLDKLLTRLPRELLGGQRQRVAMGRAMVRNPEVFLFDEPLSNLDAKLRVQMRTEIRALHQRLGTTSIYVTHDQVEAMTMADRIVVLRDGLVEQMGSPTELYDRPINTFVAAFIGSPSMNLLTGTVQNGAVNFDAEFNARLAMPINVRIEDAANITVGIRPEDFRVVPIGSPGSISAQVNITEFTGADTQLICTVNGQEVIVVLHERATAKVGEVIGLTCAAEKLHLFDTASGIRL